MPSTFRPSFDLSLHFLQLQKKPAVFLHPRRTSEALPVRASKLGGHFYWPASEQWPVCPLHDRPMVTVLQLREEDVPELSFPQGKKLFQVLWCPDQDHEQTNYGPYPIGIWRHVPPDDQTELLQPDQVPPAAPSVEDFTIPKPCKLLPERMEEYPDICELMQISDTLHEDIESWIAENAEQDLEDLGISPDDNIYQDCWGASPNTKVGGWVY